MKRIIPTSGLLFTSVSAILGSGWLFSAYYTAQIAGPSALISWLIGGFLIVILAFVFAETCAMLPITGSTTRTPHITHGNSTAFVFSWIIWLSYLALTPTEVQAVVQYGSFFFPNWVFVNGGLTHVGLIVAAALMILISVLNTKSLKWLIRANSSMTVIKIAVPLIVALVMLTTVFSPNHLCHPSHSNFIPYGMHGILGAISTGGVLFSFNGFKTAAEMAGEAKNPGKSLPIAIIGSVTICLLIFLLLQAAFLCSLKPHNIFSGWRHIQLAHHNSPFSALASQDHLNWLNPLIYIGAICAPLASALMYCSNAARTLYAMSKNGNIPSIFQMLSSSGCPSMAIAVNFVFGMVMFLPFPGWNSMVTFLTALIALTYCPGPVCLVSLRYQLPQHTRPFRLPCVWLWGFLGFYVCSLLCFWSGWHILVRMFFAVGLGVVLYAIYYLVKLKQRNMNLNLPQVLWAVIYFIGLCLISYLSDFGGGTGFLHGAIAYVVLAVFSGIILVYAVYSRLESSLVRQHVGQLKL